MGPLTRKCPYKVKLDSRSLRGLLLEATGKREAPLSLSMPGPIWGGICHQTTADALGFHEAGRWLSTAGQKPWWIRWLCKGSSRLEPHPIGPEPEIIQDWAHELGESESRWIGGFGGNFRWPRTSQTKSRLLGRFVKASHGILHSKAQEK